MAVARRSRWPGAQGPGGNGLPEEIEGTARLGRKTKMLVKRLVPGEIAVIDHRDLDRVSGEDLITAGVVAVLNCKPSSTGGYPNMGPLLLVEAGIPSVDIERHVLFDSVDECDQ